MKLPAPVKTRLEDPHFMKAFHGWSVLFWFIVGVAAALYSIIIDGQPPSFAFLMFVSMYALSESALAAWQAAAGSLKQQTK